MDLKKRNIYAVITVLSLSLVIGIIIINSEINTTGWSSDVKVKMGSCQPSVLLLGHNFSEIWVSVNGMEKTLEEALSTPNGLCGGYAPGPVTSYSINNTGHSAPYSYFAEGVFDGKNIWLIPSTSGVLIKVNLETGEMTNYPANYSAYANSGRFSGGVFDGKNIWMVPARASYLVKVDTATGKMTNYSANYGQIPSSGASAFAGGVFDGQNVWLVPSGSTKLVKVDTATGKMTNYSASYNQQWQGGSVVAHPFSGGVSDGKNIWLIPSLSRKLVKVDTATGKMTNYSINGTGNPSQSQCGSSKEYRYSHAVFDGQNVWLIPESAPPNKPISLVKVNPETGEMTNYPTGMISHPAYCNGFNKGLFDGETIWARGSGGTLKFTVATGTMVNSSMMGNYGSQMIFDEKDYWFIPPTYFSKLGKLTIKEGYSSPDIPDLSNLATEIEVSLGGVSMTFQEAIDAGKFC